MPQERQFPQAMDGENVGEIVSSVVQLLIEGIGLVSIVEITLAWLNSVEVVLAIVVGVRPANGVSLAKTFGNVGDDSMVNSSPPVGEHVDPIEFRIESVFDPIEQIPLESIDIPE